MQKRKAAGDASPNTPAAGKKSARRSHDVGTTGSAASEVPRVPSFVDIAPLIVTTATPRQRNISPHDAASPSAAAAGFAFGLRDDEKVLANVKRGLPIAAAADLALVVNSTSALKALCNMVKVEVGLAKAASLKSVHDALNMSSRARRTVVAALIQEDVAPACVAMITQSALVYSGGGGGGGDSSGGGGGSSGSLAIGSSGGDGGGGGSGAADLIVGDDQKSMAAFLLSSVAFQSPEQAARVAALGAIPPLVAMLCSPSPQQHKAAACTLAELLHDNADGCRTVVSELDGVPKLVHLLASSASDSVRKWSLSVLLKIAHADVPEFSAGIIAAGAVPYIVRFACCVRVRCVREPAHPSLRLLVLSSAHALTHPLVRSLSFSFLLVVARSLAHRDPPIH
jgi:hypothetical protein